MVIFIYEWALLDPGACIIANTGMDIEVTLYIPNNKSIKPANKTNY